MIADNLISVTNEGYSVYQCGDFTLIPGVPVKVPTSFIEQFGMMPDLRIDYGGLSDLLAARTEDGRPILDMYGPISRVDGYGRHFLDLYQGMVDIGAAANLRRTPRFNIDEMYLNPSIMVTANNNRGKVPARVAVSFTLPYDPTIWNNKSLVKIVLTQFETTRMPKVHVENINKCDHLIVTTSYQVEVCRNSGVRIPISVMTPGVDTGFFTPAEPRSDRQFRCLILGALTGRKNPLGAIEIFRQASQGDPSWRLTIKSRNADGIDEVRKVAGNDHRINVIVEDSAPEHVLDYYHSHDCLLWPSKGEGVGLPPLEALSCGLEVVCAYNSGMMDFISDEWAWPIETERTEAAGWPGNLNGFSREYIQEFGDVGEWFVPSQSSAIEQLSAAHAAWKNDNGKGRLAAAEVRRHHTLRQQAQSVLDVVEPYLGV